MIPTPMNKTTFIYFSFSAAPTAKNLVPHFYLSFCTIASNGHKNIVVCLSQFTSDKEAGKFISLFFPPLLLTGTWNNCFVALISYHSIFIPLSELLYQKQRSMNNNIFRQFFVDFSCFSFISKTFLSITKSDIVTRKWRKKYSMAYLHPRLVFFKIEGFRYAKIFVGTRGGGCN